jgi:hypothetical protein
VTSLASGNHPGNYYYNTTAVIGDPRNDENLIVGGLHTAFLKFHNHVVDYVRAHGHLNQAEAFLEARLLTTWHYQWLIVHEFLPLFLGKDLVDDILENGPRFYKPKRGQGFIPVEFQTGSYRFGHSIVRPSYRANLQGNNGGPFFGFIFDPTQHPEDFNPPLAPLSDPSELSGRARAPRRFIGWQTFFDFGDGQVKPNKVIDTTLSSPLVTLSLRAIPPHTGPTALPQRNLLRHVTWSLPSGQAVARYMGVSPLSPDHFSELATYGLGLEASTPLWYYVLREAAVTQTTQPTLVPSPPPTPTTTRGGLRLGPVGGRIVGEVIIGLLTADPTSYLAAAPWWRPILPTRSGTTGTFRMIDLLTYAGVDPNSRGQ